MSAPGTQRTSKVTVENNPGTQLDSKMTRKMLTKNRQIDCPIVLHQNIQIATNHAHVLDKMFKRAPPYTADVRRRKALNASKTPKHRNENTRSKIPLQLV